MDGLVVLVVLLLILSATAPGLYALHRRMKAGNGELELWRVLRRRGLSRADAEHAPRALGGAERRCMLCPSAKACQEGLASERPARLEEFCPNADYIKRLERC